jgi:hypothetical protein
LSPHTVENSLFSSISCQTLLHISKNHWLAWMVKCALHLNFMHQYIFRTTYLFLQRFKWIFFPVLFVIKLSST